MPSRIKVLEELRKLQPLPKVHYSWGLSKTLMFREPEVMYELARLTHGLSLFGEGAELQYIDKCVDTCDKVNETNPEIPSSIAIVFSPWHYKFRPDLGLMEPIPVEYNHTIFNNRTYQEEIDYFVNGMTVFKQLVSQSNQTYGSDVKVGALLLDSERFHRRNYDPMWNEAIAKAQNDIHIKAVEIFPDARIEWYGRAGRAPSLSDTTTYPNNYLVDGHILTGMSMSWYSPTYPAKMQNLFQADCDYADTHEIDGQFPWRGFDMTPWVALAWGFDWEKFSTGAPGIECYKYWDYALSYSRQIGALLNSSTSPYNRAKVIVFFPEPFRKKSAPYYDIDSVWTKHFIEYCKGAV